MIPEVYRPFIQKIIEKTNDNDAKWEMTGEKSYFLRTSAATIEIGYYVDQDAELSYYYFKFFNIKNKTDAGFRVNNLEEDNLIMEKLYSVAAASATNIKDELSSFLDDL